MKKVAVTRLLTLIIAAAMLTTSALAQTSSPTASGALPNLPESDALVYLNLRRILGEALPRILPEKLMGEVKAGIDQLKQKTGVDLNGVENAALALRYGTGPGSAISDAVFVVRGSFNTDALLSLMRVALQGKYREEKYGSKTLTMLKLSDLMSSGDGKGSADVLGIKEVAVTSLDEGTLAAGSVDYLKATIDAQSGQGNIQPELSSLVMKDSNALLSIAGNIPPGLLGSLVPKDAQGNEEITKLISSINRLYLSFGMDAASFTLLLSIRTDSPERARALSGLIDMFSHGMSGGIKDKGIKEVLDALKVTVEDTEVQLRTSMSQDTIATFIRSLIQPAAKPASESKAPKAAQKKPAPKRTTTKKH